MSDSNPYNSASSSNTLGDYTPQSFIYMISFGSLCPVAGELGMCRESTIRKYSSHGDNSEIGA